MAGYLYCTMECRPAEEAAVVETETDRKDREAARLEVAPVKPGDDPPTYGDEGGGNVYSEGSLEESPSRRPTLLRRLRESLVRSLGGPAGLLPPA